ncbi:MAG: hypothetical protein ACFFFG_08975 [Candidatus Thorarchaeota archaeon]
MSNSGEKIEKVKKDHDTANYLEPIPSDSFIRHQLLTLFADVGLEDFQSQILLSIVLHGGQIKPITLAKDIGCSPARLELPDGFPSLINLNLIAMSHTRPKTVVLAIGIEELIERLSMRTIKPNNLFHPKEARELLIKLDHFTQISYSQNSNRNKTDEFVFLLEYYSHLQLLKNKFSSLPSMILYTLLSLGMSLKEAIIITKLIACGGKVSKRDFFLEHIKNIDITASFGNSRHLEDDFKLLGYTGEILEMMIRNCNAFFSQKIDQSQLSSEQQFNMTLNCLQNFCQTTSMGKKKGKRKLKYLTLVKTLSQLSDFLYQSFEDFKRRHEIEFQTLQMAYSNVKLVDRDIFLSSIADPSSTRKRLETDLKYAEKIYLVLIHSYFVEDIFLKIFASDKVDSGLHLIVAEEQKELFIDMLKKHREGIHGKRGMSAADTVTFTPSVAIPQDVLVGNTIVLFYKVGSSMIIIQEEITKENPTEINTIPNDVELASKRFNKIRENNPESTTAMISLINSTGE